MCHGPLLTGQKDGYPGPALKGAAFADPSYDFHVSEIFNFIAKLMPPGTPGSLTRDEDVVIMAYLLQQNGYQQGSRIEWFLPVNTLIFRVLTDQSLSRLADVMRNSGDAVMALYTQLGTLAPVSPAKMMALM